ncbi:MAG: NAD-dependent epimerase/dehydratase family protein [Chloroflexota bacterium]|nr:NAD-dependent epimerase/dehydratase family protein [Chloroflexota bacterium]
MQKGNGRSAFVTGGAGFIGSHVVETLVRDGWHVSVVDDLSGGDRANLPVGVPLVVCDIADPALMQVFVDGEFDAVIHCAAQTSVPHSVADPAFDRQVNLVGTENVVRCAKATGVGRFAFFSSGGAVYGDTTIRADETTLPAPLSPYGVHKLAAEGYVTLSGLSYAILRPANVYGPRQRAGTDGGVIATFVDRLSHGETLHVNGDGEQVRDFVYVADVAAAVRSALAWDCSGIWNVASGAETTVNDLARYVGQALGIVPTVAYGPARAGDVRISRLSNERIIQQGGWRPEYTLARGLAVMVATKVDADMTVAD